MKNKQKKFKCLVLLILFIILIQPVYTQNSSNLIKYWYYRNRLNNYFVVPGLKQGESQIICVRNKYTESNQPYDPGRINVDYGQHGKYTGLYLGVLATEYYLLYKNGQYADAAQTGDELYKALMAVQVYWDEAAEEYWETHYGVNYSNHYNGFFIRGNVPCDFFKRQTENLIS